MLQYRAQFGLERGRNGIAAQFLLYWSGAAQQIQLPAHRLGVVAQRGAAAEQGRERGEQQQPAQAHQRRPRAVRTRCARSWSNAPRSAMLERSAFEKSRDLARRMCGNQHAAVAERQAPRGRASPPPRSPPAAPRRRWCPADVSACVPVPKDGCRRSRPVRTVAGTFQADCARCRGWRRAGVCPRQRFSRRRPAMHARTGVPISTTRPMRRSP